MLFNQMRFIQRPMRLWRCYHETRSVALRYRPHSPPSSTYVPLGAAFRPSKTSEPSRIDDEIHAAAHSPPSSTYVPLGAALRPGKISGPSRIDDEIHAADLHSHDNHVVDDTISDPVPVSSLSLPTTTLPTTLTSSTLNTYTVNIPPTPSQLRDAATFFSAQPPTLLWTVAKAHECPPSPFPEVAFLGRSNVGKSSLFNALLGRRSAPSHTTSSTAIARVSSRPGRTRTMNAFSVGGNGLIGAAPSAPPARGADGSLINPSPSPNTTRWKRLGPGGLVIVDMPGYGAGSRAEWGSAIMHYLTGRTQLRRTFVLIDAEHGLKRTDREILGHLHAKGIPFQVVLSKVDKVLVPGGKSVKEGGEAWGKRIEELRMTREGVVQEVQAVLREAVGMSKKQRDVAMDVLCVSAEKAMEGKGGKRKIGVDELRWAVMSACGIGDGE